MNLTTPPSPPDPPTAKLLRDEDRFGPSAQAMLRDQLIPREITDRRVLAAMRSVPRHLFVAPAWQDEAYLDQPLPTLSGQTISQPYMVAVMTQMLDPQPGHRVLEIGTGSGYQTMILALLSGWVVSIERHEELAAGARAVLDDLGVRNIDIQIGDGTLGYERAAPYDRILVTAGAPWVPPALEAQLALHGRLIIPVGDRDAQTLYTVQRTEQGMIRTPSISCRFVPLTGAQGWKDDSGL